MSNTNTQNANPDSPSHKITTATSNNTDTTLIKGGSQNNESGIGNTTAVHGTNDQQLKYENERLKMALAQR